MIHILFFASIREQLGIDKLSMEFTGTGTGTVEQLIVQLAERKGSIWAEVLCAPNVIVALNQEVVDQASVVRSGDEVAFFPPVTGG